MSPQRQDFIHAFGMLVDRGLGLGCAGLHDATLFIKARHGLLHHLLRLLHSVGKLLPVVRQNAICVDLQRLNLITKRRQHGIKGRLDLVAL